MESNPEAMTLEAFLQRDDLFSWQSLLSIFRQIVLGLQIAQKMFGFMHFDLLPWNILLFPNKKMQPVTVRFPGYDIELKNCKWVVKIIDFDKSHIVFNGRSLSNSVPFFRSASHDVKCFWYHCGFTVLKKYQLKKDELGVLIRILEMVSGERFQRMADWKVFLMEEKKYSNLCRPVAKDGKLVLSDFDFLFKNEECVKRTALNNWTLYGRVVGTIRRLEEQDESEIENDDVLMDEADTSIVRFLKRTYYLEIPVHADVRYPMFSVSEVPKYHGQFHLVYKLIEYIVNEASCTTKHVKKTIQKYFNLL
jgi:hypothetical protein